MDRLTTALCGDAAFVVLDAEANAAILEAAVARLETERIATIRIRNPLTAPLSFERAMLQLAPENDDQDSLSPEGTRRLVNAMTSRAAGQPSLLVVVEDAETLTVSALELLQFLPGLQAPGVDRVRVAFLGGPAFRLLLEDPRFQTIRDDHFEPPAPTETAPPVQDTAEIAAGLLPSAKRSPGKRRLIAVLGAAAVAVLVAAALWPGSSPIGPAPVTASAPIPSAVVMPPTPDDEVAPPAPTVADTGATPSSSVLPAEEPRAPPAAEAALPPSAVAEDPVVARSRVFREFNAFVEARGLADRLSQSDREALFQEYLTRRYTEAVPEATPRALNAPATVAASDLPQVLLFYTDGTPGIGALANQLRERVPDVTLNQVPNGLSEPIVNYFRPEDRALALALVGGLPRVATDWRVVDMSGTAGRPTRSTIEIWLPRQSGVP